MGETHEPKKKKQEVPPPEPVQGELPLFEGVKLSPKSEPATSIKLSPPPQPIVEEDGPGQISMFDDKGRGGISESALPRLPELTVMFGSIAEGKVEYGLGQQRLRCTFGREEKNYRFEVSTVDGLELSVSLQPPADDAKQLTSYGPRDQMTSMWLTVNQSHVDDETRQLFHRAFTDISKQIGRNVFYASFQEYDDEPEHRTSFLGRDGLQFNQVAQIDGRKDMGTSDWYLFARKF